MLCYVMLCYVMLMLLFYVMYGLLAKCEVKMAEYWPSSFFAGGSRGP